MCDAARALSTKYADEMEQLMLEFEEMFSSNVTMSGRQYAGSIVCGDTRVFNFQLGGDKSGGGPFGGGAGEEMWRPQFVQSVAKQMAAHGGLGLAVPVFNKMLQMQEAQQGKAA